MPRAKCRGTNKDGTLVATEEANPTFDPQKKATEDIGLWKQTAPRTFEYINYVLFSDPTGKPAGKLRVRGRYTLTSSDTYSGESFFEVLDDTDEHVVFDGRVHNEGTRKPFLPYPF